MRPLIIGPEQKKLIADAMRKALSETDRRRAIQGGVDRVIEARGGGELRRVQLPGGRLRLNVVPVVVDGRVPVRQGDVAMLDRD